MKKQRKSRLLVGNRNEVRDARTVRHKNTRTLRRSAPRVRLNRFGKDKQPTLDDCVLVVVVEPKWLRRGGGHNIPADVGGWKPGRASR